MHSHVPQANCRKTRLNKISDDTTSHHLKAKYSFHFFASVIKFQEIWRMLTGINQWDNCIINITQAVKSVPALPGSRRMARQTNVRGSLPVFFRKRSRRQGQSEKRILLHLSPNATDRLNDWLANLTKNTKMRSLSARTFIWTKARNGTQQGHSLKKKDYFLYTSSIFRFMRRMQHTNERKYLSRPSSSIVESELPSIILQKFT